MAFKIEGDGPDLTVTFSGDVTFSENVKFRQLLKDLGGRKIESCNFDLAGVNMIDSAGLGMLLIAREQAESTGWKLTVSGAHGHVQNMLKLTKLVDLLS